MFDDDNAKFYVVVNREEQYSIWPEGRDVPDGWRIVREPAPRQESLDYIEGVWTDMRPLSLRQQLDGEASGGGQPGE
ncbi:MAG: MbtH family NRPS accessory protein [Acidobacteriota bacterium]